jgi:hypothetical protein
MKPVIRAPSTPELARLKQSLSEEPSIIQWRMATCKPWQGPSEGGLVYPAPPRPYRQDQAFLA